MLGSVRLGASSYVHTLTYRGRLGLGQPILAIATDEIPDYNRFAELDTLSTSTSPIQMTTDMAGVTKVSKDNWASSSSLPLLQKMVIPLLKFAPAVAMLMADQPDLSGSRCVYDTILAASAYAKVDHWHKAG